MVWSLLLLVVCGAGENASPHEPPQVEAAIVDLRTQQRIDVAALADDLARRDVIFLGEEHDNGAGHRLQLQIVTALLERRPDLTISMEMFERDVQGVLNDYLRGRIDEKDFLAHSRPWDNYAEDYRPIIELARAKHLDVIAANVPHKLAKQVFTGETPGNHDQMFLPRRTSSPRDAYWERFSRVIQMHAGAEEEGDIERFYQAQCLKDDAMAEAITDYIAGYPHRAPCIVHLCGRFHSDYGDGTVSRVLSRQPLLQVGVVTMDTAPDLSDIDLTPHRHRSHFLILFPSAEKSEKPASTAAR